MQYAKRKNQRMNKKKKNKYSQRRATEEYMMNFTETIYMKWADKQNGVSMWRALSHIVKYCVVKQRYDIIIPHSAQTFVWVSKCVRDRMGPYAAALHISCPLTFFLLSYSIRFDSAWSRILIHPFIQSLRWNPMCFSACQITTWTSILIFSFLVHFTIAVFAFFDYECMCARACLLLCVWVNVCYSFLVHILFQLDFMCFFFLSRSKYFQSFVSIPNIYFEKIKNKKQWIQSVWLL